MGKLSEHFMILQGVRQGGILLLFLYKTYKNPVLKNLGLSLGVIYCGCPTCADDVAHLGQVWYLIETIPDLCTINYFYYQIVRMSSR